MATLKTLSLAVRQRGRNLPLFAKVCRLPLRQGRSVRYHSLRSFLMLPHSLDFVPPIYETATNVVFCRFLFFLGLQLVPVPHLKIIVFALFLRAEPVQLVNLPLCFQVLLLNLQFVYLYSQVVGLCFQVVYFYFLIPLVKFR